MNRFEAGSILSPQTYTFIERFLGTSRYLSLVVLDSEFVIQQCNRGFSLLFGSKNNLVSTSLYAYLLPESQRQLTSQILNKEMPVQLHFIDQDNLTISLECHISPIDSGYLLFCDHALLADDDILQKLTTINSEMIVLTRELDRKNRTLVEARQQIKALSGIIPICMHCKEIRDDQGYWNNLEGFIMQHSDAQFSHGICPKCMKERFPEEPSTE